MLRVSLIEGTPSKPLDLALLSTALGLRISQIDRRPSLRAKPFHDVYFLQVERACDELSDTIQVKLWRKVLEEALERVHEVSWEGCIIGTW